jgi:transcriptional regulator with XRE-family HTH domain
MAASANRQARYIQAQAAPMSHPEIVREQEEAAEQGVTTASRDIDRYRSIVFPNAVRELRKQQGFARLLGLSAVLPDIPYVRLSKIERGEVVAKASELRSIAVAMRVAPEDLLLDIDDPAFDIADWATELQGWTEEEIAEDRFAVLLAAAIRARRDADRTLSIANVERRFGIAPVILSRLENGYKPLGRWNAQTVRAVCALLGVADARALRAYIAQADAEGALHPYLPVAASSAARIEKTRARVALLRKELQDPMQLPTARTKAAQPLRVVASAPEPNEADTAVLAAIEQSETATVRLVPVFGAPLADGLIDRVPVGRTVEAPRHAQPNSYGLRVCRATLGPALPAHAIVVVDPDRFPSSGGLAVMREPGGLRLLVVTFDRQGRMIGYSLNPDREIELDSLEPTDLGTVVAVLLD